MVWVISLLIVIAFGIIAFDSWDERRSVRVEGKGVNAAKSYFDNESKQYARAHNRDKFVAWILLSGLIVLAALSVLAIALA